MNSKADTDQLVTSDGSTEQMKPQTSLTDYVMPKELAHKILNRIKDGEIYNPVIVTRALLATGDWQ
jgi:hypothetical protein